jgi:hypothetical protein
MAAFSQSIDGPSGSQRLHGRKPVALAASRRIVELNVLRVCGSRGARRSAIDPGRHDRIPELTVRSAVARDDTRPARIIGYGYLSGAPRVFERRDHGGPFHNLWSVAILPWAMAHRTPSLAFKLDQPGTSRSVVTAGHGARGGQDLPSSLYIAPGAGGCTVRDCREYGVPGTAACLRDDRASLRPCAGQETRPNSS